MGKKKGHMLHTSLEHGGWTCTQLLPWQDLSSLSGAPSDL